MKQERECQAVTEENFDGNVNNIQICCARPLDKPTPLYVPLCAAHRAMAEHGEIRVFTNRVIAVYRL